MKQLMILRHAQALGVEPGGDDKSRKLSPKGIEDAKALGALMERQNLQPDLVLCSAAVRTRQTLDGLLNVIAVGRIDYSDTLYNADFSVLLNAVQGQSNDINSLLLVAHNPGIHTFSARLASDESEQFLIERLTCFDDRCEPAIITFSTQFSMLFRVVMTVMKKCAARWLTF